MFKLGAVLLVGACVIVCMRAIVRLLEIMDDGLYPIPTEEEQAYYDSLDWEEVYE